MVETQIRFCALTKPSELTRVVGVVQRSWGAPSDPCPTSQETLPGILGYSALCLRCVRQGVWYSGQWNRLSFLRNEMSAVAEWVLKSRACNFVSSKVISEIYKGSTNYMTTRTKRPRFWIGKAFHPEAVREDEVCSLTIQVREKSWTISHKGLNLRYAKPPKLRLGEHRNNRKSCLSKLLNKLAAFHFAENTSCSFLIFSKMICI